MTPRNKVYARELARCLLGIVLVIGAWFWLFRAGYADLLGSICLFDLMISSLLAALTFVVSGIQVSYLVRVQNQIRLKPFDVATLPLVMNLWSYIIPTQGSALYFLMFLKAKYAVAFHQSLATAIYSYLIAILLAGFMGLYYCFVQEMFFSAFGLISVLFLLSPLILQLLKKLFGSIKVAKRIPWLARLERVLILVFESTGNLIRNPGVALVTVSISLLYTATTVLWFYWTSQSAGLNIPITELILLVLTKRLSLILKMTPGNLGTEQLVSGGAMALMGSQPERGVALSLLIAFSSLIVVASVGGVVTALNTRYMTLGQMFNNQEGHTQAKSKSVKGQGNAHL